jgi:hypothetical protein
LLRLREYFDRSYPRLVERLERLGVPRRWPPLLIVGVVAATMSVVLATVVWITGLSGPDDPPIAVLPASAGKDGSAVVTAASAQLRSGRDGDPEPLGGRLGRVRHRTAMPLLGRDRPGRRQGHRAGVAGAVRDAAERGRGDRGGSTHGGHPDRRRDRAVPDDVRRARDVEG